MLVLWLIYSFPFDFHLLSCCKIFTMCDGIQLTATANIQLAP